METASLRAKEPARSRPGTAQVLPALLVLALVFLLGLAHEARARGRAAPLLPQVWVDPAEARVVAAPAWVDPRWLEHLGVLLEAQAPIEVAVAGELEALRAEVAALSFVERVERCELSVARGLELELSLREPVACIPAGGEFALVDEDGVVLEGRWPSPPRLGRAWLPVLGPLTDPVFARARPGDWLVEPEHKDALDVALSLAEHFDEDQRAELGRMVIDAQAARRSAVEEPGVRLELEGERVALFGRAPGTDEPGELAARSKWQALTRALELFERDPAENDWELVDLRWDRPDIALRRAPTVAELADETPRTRSKRERSEPDDSRARVR
jgi:hypothetical protein